MDHGALAQEEFRKPGKYLKVRLNLPNTLKPEEGRLYVTCHYHSKAFGRPEAETLPSVTMAVDPWDLTLPSEFQGTPATSCASSSPWLFNAREGGAGRACPSRSRTIRWWMSGRSRARRQHHREESPATTSAT